MASRRPTEPTEPRRSTPEDKPTPAPVTAVTKAPRTRAKSATPRVRKKAVKKAPVQVTVSEDVRRGMIAEGAYLRSERRGFAPGHEDEDWLAAEAEVDALLKARAGSTAQ